MSNIPLCPVVEPTEEELALSPLDFIQLLHRRFGEYGIVKVVIPPEKRPRYAGLKAGVRFRAKIQPLHLLDGKLREARYTKILERIEMWRSLREKSPSAFLGRASPDDFLGKSFYKAYGNGDVLIGKVVGYDGKIFEVDFGKEQLKTPDTPLTTPSSTPVRRPGARLLKRLDSGFAAVLGRERYDLGELRIFMENGQSEEDARKLLDIFERNDPNEKFCGVCSKVAVCDTVVCLGECGELVHKMCCSEADLWACDHCTDRDFPTLKRLISFGYQLTTTVDTKEFATRSLQEDDETDPETKFLDAVHGRLGDVTAIYGSDLDSLQVETFPDDAEIKRLRDSEEFWKGPLDLRLLPVHPKSLLSTLYDSDVTINGVSRPWTYVGSPLSAFCWHAEDHWLYSVNYLHQGQAKIWYGVPGDRIDHVEDFFRSQFPLLYSHHNDLHHHLVTFIDPNAMRQAGISVYKAEQNEGDLIVTFPRAYHAGFNSGFNVAEAVNVGCPDWLRFGLVSDRRYALERRPQVLCMEFLVWAITKQHLYDASGALLSETGSDVAGAAIILHELKTISDIYERMPGHLEILPLDLAESHGRRKQRKSRILLPTPSSASVTSEAAKPSPYLKCASCGRLNFFLVIRSKDGEFHCASHTGEIKAEFAFEGTPKGKIDEAIRLLSEQVAPFVSWKEDAEELVEEVTRRRTHSSARNICQLPRKRKRDHSAAACLNAEELDRWNDLVERGTQSFRLPPYDETLWKLRKLCEFC